MTPWGGISAGGTVLPFALYTFGLTYLPATQVSIISTMEPVVAGGAGFLLLGEVLDWPQLFGGALVVTGVVLVQRGSAPPRNGPAVVPARHRGSLRDDVLSDLSSLPVPPSRGTHLDDPDDGGQHKPSEDRQENERFYS